MDTVYLFKVFNFLSQMLALDFNLIPGIYFKGNSSTKNENALQMWVSDTQMQYFI